MSREYVVIYHPEAGASKVLPQSVDVWLRNGWSLEKPRKTKRDLPSVEESKSSSLDATEA